MREAQESLEELKTTQEEFQTKSNELEKVKKILFELTSPINYNRKYKNLKSLGISNFNR